MGIESDCCGQLQQFRNVHSALAAFDVGNEWLMSAELGSDLRLKLARTLSVLTDELSQPLMSF